MDSFDVVCLGQVCYENILGGVFKILIVASMEVLVANVYKYGGCIPRWVQKITEEIVTYFLPIMNHRGDIVVDNGSILFRSSAYFKVYIHRQHTTRTWYTNCIQTHLYTIVHTHSYLYTICIHTLTHIYTNCIRTNTRAHTNTPILY